uniref:Thioredoxin domain-containing protein n=1 Tax=viral metagenome TaxID=1070528 RepID=A0A6C0EQV2_9ZZZZ
MPQPIIEDTISLQAFLDLLKTNQGLIILKFGAEWCGPCKKIEQQVYAGFNQMPMNVQPIIVDVDDSFELYAFLKSKKMVKSIPTLLCYEKGNVSYVPDHVVVGANVDEINTFFQECFNKAKDLLH